MNHSYRKVFGLLLLSSVAGCNVLSTHQSMNAVTDQEAQRVETFPIAPHLFSPDGEFSSVDIKELKPGQKVQVLARSQPEPQQQQWVDSDNIIAGVVEEVSNTGLVLNNVVQVTYAVTQDQSTMLSRVPYVSRLFKNMSMGATANHIPGTVSLSRNEVLATSVLTEEAYRALSNGRPPRIGVDFDVVEAIAPE